jgi:hypothetical protein
MKKNKEDMDRMIEEEKRREIVYYKKLFDKF